VDKHESARAVKKAELIDNLKRLYPGVVSSVYCIRHTQNTLCQCWEYSVSRL